MRVYMMLTIEENKERLKEHNKKYRWENREQILKRKKKYYVDNREKERARVLRNYHHDAKWRERKYGVTNQDYQNMLVEQNNCCAICGKHQSREKHALSVDHNHQTGEVRGLLCKRCNHYLAVLEDTIFVGRAKEYLDKKFSPAV